MARCFLDRTSYVQFISTNIFFQISLYMYYRKGGKHIRIRLCQIYPTYGNGLNRAYANVCNLTIVMYTLTNFDILNLLSGSWLQEIKMCGKFESQPHGIDHHVFCNLALLLSLLFFLISKNLLITEQDFFCLRKYKSFINVNIRFRRHKCVFNLFFFKCKCEKSRL